MNIEFNKVVKTYIKHFEENVLLEEDKLSDEYGGFCVFMTPVIKNSKIWFLGINPGTGSKKLNGENFTSEEVIEIPKNEKSSFVDTEGNSFAKNIINLFDNINGLDITKDSTWTNLHFIATEDKKTLVKILNKTYKNKHDEYDKYWDFVKETNLKLLDEINPKLIFLMGADVKKDFFDWELMKKENIFLNFTEEKLYGDHSIQQFIYKGKSITLVNPHRCMNSFSLNGREELFEKINEILNKE